MSIELYRDKNEFQTRAGMSLPTRKSLLSRLRNWADNESWQVFFEMYWKLIYGVALKAGLTHEEAQDVVQETVVAVAKHIGGFRYDPKVCSFKGWLLRVTRSKIARQFTKRKSLNLGRQPAKEDTSLTPLIERLPGPDWLTLEEIWDQEWRKNLVDAAIARVKSRVSIEQYQIFDLYALKNRPVREVAHTLGVTVAHVYVAKHRISRLIAREIKQLEKRNL